jgi:hypothetical protein
MLQWVVHNKSNLWKRVTGPCVLSRWACSFLSNKPVSRSSAYIFDEGEHDNYYTTDELTIYLTRGEHDNYYTTDACNYNENSKTSM